MSTLMSSLKWTYTKIWVYLLRLTVLASPSTAFDSLEGLESPLDSLEGPELLSDSLLEGPDLNKKSGK